MTRVGIPELKTGDKFIWADHDTRMIMLVDPSHSYRAGIMEFIEHTAHDTFQFKDVYNGGVFDYCYGKQCRVYRVKSVHDVSVDIPFEVECLNCGHTYGDHKGMGCKTKGINQTGVFMPDQRSAIRVDADFFAELGL